MIFCAQILKKFFKKIVSKKNNVLVLKSFNNNIVCKSKIYIENVGWTIKQTRDKGGLRVAIFNQLTQSSVVLS